MPNQVTLLHLDIPMNEPLQLSSGSIASREAILVLLEREELVGLGEASPLIGAQPAITPDSIWDFLEQYAIPELIRERTMRPTFVGDRFARHPEQTSGWAGLEAAILDLTLQEQASGFLEWFELEPRPLEATLAVGIQPNIEELVRAGRKYMKHGYRRLKVMIEPGWDLEPLRAARETFPDHVLAADANGAYGDEQGEIFEQIDQLGLAMIEQPLAPDNFDGHRALQRRLRTPISFDEGAREWQRLEAAFAADACRIVNIKPQRLGGLLAARRIVDRCAKHRIPTFIGTTPELGLGALHGLYLAMHPNCGPATDICASRRWFVDDIIDPPLEVHEGIIEIPEAHRRRPQVSMDAVDRFTRRAKSIRF